MTRAARERLERKLEQVRDDLVLYRNMRKRILRNERVRDYAQSSNRASRDEIPIKDLQKIIDDLEAWETKLEQMLEGGAMRAQAVVPQDW